MKKRLLSVFLIFGMLFLQSFSTLAAAPATNFPNDIEDTIIDQALALEQAVNVEGKEFTVVVLNKSDTDIDPLSGDSITTGQAIQAVSTKGDLIEVTTIFPYKIMPDGELINSFEYTPTQIARDSTNPTYYAEYSNIDIATNFYRHGGIEAYWNSSNSTAKVSNMHVIYESSGHMYQYPECTTASYKTLSSFLIQENYFISSSINQDNPERPVLFRWRSYYGSQHCTGLCKCARAWWNDFC